MEIFAQAVDGLYEIMQKHQYVKKHGYDIC